MTMVRFLVKIKNDSTHKSEVWVRSTSVRRGKEEVAKRLGVEAKELRVLFQWEKVKC